VPDLPKQVYGVFCGAITQEAAQKIATMVGVASNGGVEHVHLLFQSLGGNVGDGVFLYNLFKSLPFDLTLYNSGQVSSIAAVAYLGAKGRKTSATALFMLHRSTNSPQFATAAKMASIVKSLTLEDARTDLILREKIRFDEEQWSNLERHDLFLSAAEAVEYGIADEIADFAPPMGTKLFTVG
jgi:ATP-dependent Clp protease protease subunit